RRAHAAPRARRGGPPRQRRRGRAGAVPVRAGGQAGRARAELLMKERAVDAALAREPGLSDEEYGRVLAILGRTPTFTELGIFSVMWSEHCSYKSSRVHLRGMPTSGPRVLQGPGEN